MNKVEETTPLEGLRVGKGDYNCIANALDNFKYIYFSYDGTSIRPHIVYSNSEDEHGKKEEGIILGITADGIVVKGEYTRRGTPPDMKTITTDWKKFLND